MFREKILSYYSEALNLYFGKIIESPRMAIIYPVYGCNFSCNGCLCSSLNQKKVFMNIEKFKTLISQLKSQGIKAIEFCGGGEPLLHPQIGEMINWITNYAHLDFGIITNGSLLNDKINYFLLTRAEYIRVSLYVNSFDNVIRNVKALINMKEKLGSETAIGVKFLVDSETCDEIYNFVCYVKDLNLDHISIKALRGAEQYNSDYSEFQNKIRKLNIANMHCNLEKTYLDGKCWLSPIHTLIDPLGDVYICCYYMDRKEQHCIGNAFEHSFSKIWGSDIHYKKLSQIDADKCNVFDCRWHIYNNTMRELFSKNKVQHEFC